MAGKHDGLFVEEGDEWGLYVDLIVNEGEDPHAISRELIGIRGQARYIGGEWRQGYWEAHYQGTKMQLAMVQSKSEGTPVGKPKGSHNKDYIVICVKINAINTHETKVETFGPFTHEAADAYAVALSDELPAEWMFSSQQAQGNDISPERAAQFLLNC